MEEDLWPVIKPVIRGSQSVLALLLGSLHVVHHKWRASTSQNKSVTFWALPVSGILFHLFCLQRRNRMFISHSQLTVKPIKLMQVYLIKSLLINLCHSVQTHVNKPTILKHTHGNVSIEAKFVCSKSTEESLQSAATDIDFWTCTHLIDSWPLSSPEQTDTQ